ncbi:MAG TPA: radical SAM protein [Ignavibacteriaceae bacterium]|nr:radical SAM protein [Ignavibacteriaceae bacterium]
MKILIGQSYFRILDQKELERQMPYPPLGTIYAATILKRLGHEIIFYDCMMGGNPEDFNNKIISDNPDIVLIYDDEFNYLTKMCLSNMREAALSFIKTAKSVDIPVIIYSSDATDFYSSYFDAGCDGIIYGEGEITITEIINSFGKNNYNNERINIDGLKFSDNDKVIVTAPRKMIKELDEIPDPDYSFVNINAYRETWMKNQGYFSLNISTTRGCPYKCNWCAKPIYGKTYNSRSPRLVAGQLSDLKKKYSVDHIWITDDIFGLKPGWIREFTDELMKLGLKIPYKCLSRPDLLLRNNTLPDLKKSGCKTIWIGAESGSQKILDSMDKGTTVQQIYSASEKAHNLGIEIAFFIQFGYSDENWNDIKLTREMIADCLPDDIGISVSYPLPGTKFYENVKAQMKNKTNWRDSDDLDMMFSGRFARNFYKILHRLVHTEYRMHKIIKEKNRKKLPRLFLYFFRFIVLRIQLKKYLTAVNSRLITDCKEVYHSI